MPRPIQGLGVAGRGVRKPRYRTREDVVIAMGRPADGGASAGRTAPRPSWAASLRVLGDDVGTLVPPPPPRRN